MQTEHRIQVHSMTLEQGSEEKNYKIGYQQIARHCWYITHNGCKSSVFLRYKHIKNGKKR
jgi:hypothetical protein